MAAAVETNGHANGHPTGMDVVNDQEHAKFSSGGIILPPPAIKGTVSVIVQIAITEELYSRH